MDGTSEAQGNWDLGVYDFQADIITANNYKIPSISTGETGYSIIAGNSDANVWDAKYNDAGELYSWNLLYTGTQSGNDNGLELWSSDGKVYRFTQNGDLILYSTLVDIEGDLSVNENLYVGQDLFVYDDSYFYDYVDFKNNNVVGAHLYDSFPQLSGQGMPRDNGLGGNYEKTQTLFPNLRKADGNYITVDGATVADSIAMADGNPGTWNDIYYTEGQGVNVTFHYDDCFPIHSTATSWHPYIQYRLGVGEDSTGSYFDKMQVYVSSDNITWHTSDPESNWGYDDWDTDKTLPSFWIGNTDAPNNPSSLPGWCIKHVKFELSEPVNDSDYIYGDRIWISELGLRHTSTYFSAWKNIPYTGLLMDFDLGTKKLLLGTNTKSYIQDDGSNELIINSTHGEVRFYDNDNYGIINVDDIVYHTAKFDDNKYLEKLPNKNKILRSDKKVYQFDDEIHCSNVTDRSRWELEEKCEQFADGKEVCKEKKVYPYTKLDCSGKKGGRSADINRIMIAELKEEINLLKKELCLENNKYSWCGVDNK